MTVRVFFLLMLMGFCRVFSQQTPEFQQVKAHFDNQRQLILQSFKAEFDPEKDHAKKAWMQQELAEFMVKMDSVQNDAYTTALIRVKNREDLQRLAGLQISGDTSADKDIDTNAEYPGGMNAFRNQVMQTFYSDNILTNKEVYKATVRFIVERDGSISTVEAFGDDIAFNKQAIIAVYLIPEKFTPAKIHGQPVRSRFSFPISLKFD